jgi:hypothetical protein
MKDTDIAWCAGFFDGEGHVSYHRSPPSKTGTVSPQLYAVIPQASENIEVLEFFQSVIGFGNIKGPYPMPSGKPQHRLHYGVNEVQALFIILKPYLRADKTRDFQKALASYWTHDPSINEDDQIKTVKRNKKKGCPECGDKEWNGLLCFKCGYIM